MQTINGRFRFAPGITRHLVYSTSSIALLITPDGVGRPSPCSITRNASPDQVYRHVTEAPN
eukprot:854569-Rhodomonas_salina.1